MWNKKWIKQIWETVTGMGSWIKWWSTNSYIKGWAAHCLIRLDTVSQPVEPVAGTLVPAPAFGYVTKTPEGKVQSAEVRLVELMAFQSAIGVWVDLAAFLKATSSNSQRHYQSQWKWGVIYKMLIRNNSGKFWQVNDVREPYHDTAPPSAVSNQYNKGCGSRVMLALQLIYTVNYVVSLRYKQLERIQSILKLSWVCN